MGEVKRALDSDHSGNRMTMIAPYITRAEYECHHCHALPPSMVLERDGGWPIMFKYLFCDFEDLRGEWGRAIPILSGYRCIPHNKSVGGEDGSVHIFGLALDCGFDTPADCIKFKDMARRMKSDIRIGWRRYQAEGKNIVHFDVGHFIYPKFSTALMPGVEW